MNFYKYNEYQNIKELLFKIIINLKNIILKIKWILNL